jgi:hypothetical protein
VREHDPEPKPKGNAITSDTGSRLTRVFFLLLAYAGAVMTLSTQHAGAQSGCPGVGVSAASVDVVSPRPGEQVRGVVVVRGRVSAPLAVSRVELQVGRSIVDAQSFRETPSADFSLSWDATRAPAGQASLRVVACGQGIGGVLVQGSSTVAVDVVAVPAPTQAATSTSVGTPTTVSPSTTTSSLSPSTSTSTTRTSTTLPATTTTQALPDLLTEGRAVGPAGRLLPGEVAASEGGRSYPIWVGAVVGLSGLAGLALSRVLTGRRRPGGDT